MTYELAYYYKLLILAGFHCEYFDFLNHRLEKEDPLSDVILELSFCGSDIKRILSVLDEYLLQVRQSQIDIALIKEYLRKFLLKKYSNENYTVKNIVEYMYRFAGDFGYEYMNDFCIMDDYYSMAQEGLIKPELFIEAFEEYLENGTCIDTDKMRNRPKENALEKIINMIRRIGK